jgi:UDP-N-acetylmuramate dehydrogenase
MTAPLRLSQNASLKSRNSFGIEAFAPLLVEADSVDGLREALALPAVAAATPLILGGGSNLLFADNPATAVLALTSQRIEVLGQDAGHGLIRADAGVSWHALVMWTLQHGFSGLENLALIPGTVGAAPIQNIGAYGVEVGQYVQCVETLSLHGGHLQRLDRTACAFGYRDSTFKQQPDQRIVTAVEFALPRKPTLRLDYAGIGDELAAMGVDAPDAMQVAQAVVRIRRRKLPDPAQLGNAGSFFKNPIVPVAQALALASEHTGLPVFTGHDGSSRKLSAAWMIEACGWRGFREGDAGVAAAHALVLVNHGQATGAQLLALARRIAESVRQRFGVAIEPEPKLIGARW